MKNLKVITIFVIGLFIISCNSDSSEEKQDIDTSNYRYFVSGKINGESFIFGQLEDASSLDYVLAGGGGSTTSCVYDPETGGVDYYSQVAPYSDLTEPAIGVEFVKFILCPELENQDQSDIFNSKFSVGDYVFSESPYGHGPDRSITLTYSPNFIDGPNYNTIGDQTGSFVKITASNAKSTDTQIVEGEFSVKLYNEEDDSLDVIEITNGKFKVQPSIF